VSLSGDESGYDCVRSMGEGWMHKPEVMFSNTLHDLRHCYENMDFPLVTVCSSVGVEYESLRRAQLIALCVKIAEEYGGEARMPL
jgi:hypothetical protein